MEKGKAKHYAFMCNGEIEITGITTNDVEEALDVLDNSFFLQESVCIGSEINLPESQQARTELRELCRITALDGVSLMAKHLATNKIVAVMFNKIQYSDDNDCFFIKFRDENCISPNAKCLMNYMIDMDQQIDIFKMYNIDCLMELVFLATLPDFQKMGIARALCKFSIDFARDLQQGIGISAINKKLQEKRPKAVSALMTSRFSQRCGDVLGFKVLNTVPYTKYTFNGKTFAERIGPMHPDSKQVVLMLT